MRKLEEQHLFVKSQEQTIQQLKQQVNDRDFKHQDSSRSSDVTVQRLRQTILDLELEKNEESRRHEASIQGLRSELQMAKGGAGSGEELFSLRNRVATLEARLMEVNQENERLRTGQAPLPTMSGANAP
eukprot:NODE_2341_length_941_cov_122.687220_g1924_i0.p3 GENE.NODE_2341_length_941_cov_122.687220_g1924_i0~~NODE_2341_length_941_cov_122.687220_g1924_i0.p3  ORF type:complete len:129 (-),score=44.46 NODE_2341_length_941_cov_122.687220_g1924_i0:314-700(-)